MRQRKNILTNTHKYTHYIFKVHQKSTHDRNMSKSLRFSMFEVLQWSSMGTFFLSFQIFLVFFFF